jgi:hypothetical protein
MTPRWGRHLGDAGQPGERVAQDEQDSTPVVGAAAALAALISESTPAKSVGAATIKSGAVIANDTPHLEPASLDFRENRVTPARIGDSACPARDMGIAHDPSFRELRHF